MLARNQLLPQLVRRCWMASSSSRIPSTPRGGYSSYSYYASRSFSTGKSGRDLHAFFQQELEELDSERISFFGTDANQNGPDDPVTMGEEQHQRFQKQLHELNEQEEEEESDEPTSDYDEGLEDMHAERAALFDFSDEEKQAWGNPQGTLSPEFLQEIQTAREQPESTSSIERSSSFATATIATTSTAHHPHDSFSHVSQDGSSIHMVDVGPKTVTTRTARAQTKVVLPPEVLKAFSTANTDELVGPKGPIFSTAKIAGIMAAKKTSDLIPLCHPLPLDQVQIDIRLQGNEVIIDCTCRVTHKTGVEMEALTGSTVAALTVYDMVKAVSHNVQITDTRLISKTGGKRSVSNDP